MKICKNCKKEEIENEIEKIFSCGKYDNIWRKVFNDINEKLMTSIFKQEIR